MQSNRPQKHSAQNTPVQFKNKKASNADDGNQSKQKSNQHRKSKDNPSPMETN